ncbi:MAG TPA: hypothetical protein VEA69_22540 [Tepidisphaeraceae bacterium]|nr:hypothetical protein [Tepidisphaeraceae bacterium]
MQTRLAIYDAEDGRLRARVPLDGARWIGGVWVSSDSRRCAVRYEIPGDTVFQVLSVADGALLAEVRRPSPGMRWPSPDLDRLYAIHPAPGGGGQLEAIDIGSGGTIARRAWPLNAGLLVTPDGRRLMTTDGDRRPCLLDAASLARVARFDGGMGFGVLTAMSPDGQTVTLGGTDRAIHVFRPTGPDCPESPAGVFAFPHLYLLLVAFAGAAIYLARDARRRGDRAAADAILPTLRFAPAVLLAAAGLLTAHDLLRVALGFGVNWAAPERLLAGPVLLLAAWHLPTRSRFWRYTTIALLLAALVPLALATRAALASSFAPIVPVIDTTIAVPRAVFIAAMTAAIGAALAMVAELSLAGRRLG